MSSLALPENSLPTNLHQRCEAAFAALSAGQLQNAFNLARQNGKSYALLGSDVRAFTVPVSRVEREYREATFCGRETGERHLWLQTPALAIRYDSDVVQSELFPLGRADFALNREKVDLCNAFFAIAHGMPDLQDLPSVQRLNAALRERNLKAFVTAAATLPGKGTVQPYACDLALAVTLIDKDEPALFNLSRHELRLSNWGGEYSEQPQAVPAERPPAHWLTIAPANAA